MESCEQTASLAMQGSQVANTQRDCWGERKLVLFLSEWLHITTPFPWFVFVGSHAGIFPHYIFPIVFVHIFLSPPLFRHQPGVINNRWSPWPIQ